MRIGILGLQGGVVEHAGLVKDLGHDPVLIRRPEHMRGLDALILPGGESTTLLKLLNLTGLREPLTEAASGLPTLGTCAGLIVLAALGYSMSMLNAMPSGPRSILRAPVWSGRASG